MHTQREDGKSQAKLVKILKSQAKFTNFASQPCYNDLLYNIRIVKIRKLLPDFLNFIQVCNSTSFWVKLSLRLKTVISSITTLK